MYITKALLSSCPIITFAIFKMFLCDLAQIEDKIKVLLTIVRY